jgi:hypothetical protein
MLPRADINAVKAVGPAEPVSRAEPVADTRQEAFRRTLAAMIGKSTYAEVLSRLNDGSFLVKVAGTQARMQMPAGVAAGDTVPMTVLAASPRPTFQIGGGPVVQAAWDFAAGAADLRTGQATRAGPAPLPGATPAATESPSGTASLSAAARIIASVLHAVEGAPATATLRGTAPLVGATPPPPAQLAQHLEQLISQSGLFYESHVAEWAEGKRSLPELAREPQMRATPGVPAHDPETAGMINMQLASHEQARVAWHGELGAGQPLEWELHRDAPDQPGGRDDDGAAPAWRSGLRLRLPLLGEIAATVVIAGDQLHIGLEAGSDDGCGALRAHAPALASALEAAGIALDTLQIGARAR